jgi:hypothetical protein
MPVPPQENLLFCSNNSRLEEFFQNLTDAGHHILIVLAVVILLGSIFAMIPYAIMEWWTWRRLNAHAKAAEESLQSMEKKDFLEILTMLGSPINYKVCGFVTARLRSPRRKALMRWFLAYITHPPALLVFAISMAIFISCIFQSILVNEIRKEAPALVAEVRNLQNTIAAKVQNASALWASQTNQHINETESQINEQLFGWARESTLSLNNTLNTCTTLLRYADVL